MVVGLALAAACGDDNDSADPQPASGTEATPTAPATDSASPPDEGTTSGTETTPPTTENGAPETSPADEPQSALLTVISDPPGATVEVGIKDVDNIVTIGTGRIVGVTPITELEITDADVNYGDGFTNLQIGVELDGFIPALQTIGLADTGLEPGRLYEVDVELRTP